MADETKQALDAATAAAASELKRGNNVMILDGWHGNPDFKKILADPGSLTKLHDAGATDIILEISLGGAKLFREYQQRHLSEMEIAARIRAEGRYSQLAREEGHGEEAIKDIASLVHQAGVLKMPIHGKDEMLDGYSYRSEARAIARLSDKDKETLSEYAKQMQSSTPVKPSPDVLRIEAKLRDYRWEDRTGTDPTKASPYDIQLADDLAKDVDKRLFVGAYGSGHILHVQGLSQLLAERTGRHTATIRMDNERANKIEEQYSVKDNHGGMLPPEIVYAQDHPQPAAHNAPAPPSH